MSRKNRHAKSPKAFPRETRSGLAARALERVPSWSRWLGAISLIAGSVLLLLGARGDLWFDEIWSFEWAERATSAWDVIGRFPHDNNHPLNTWWLMTVGPGKPSIFYRLLSVASGIVSLFLVGRMASALVPAARGIAVLLAALSFPLLLYFSEARGYAPAMMCSLAAALLLLESPAFPSWRRAGLFWAVCVAGMLAHATFFLALSALALWKLSQIYREIRSLPRTLSAAFAWFATPGLAAVAYGWIFLRNMQIGGGPEYAYRRVIGEFFGYSLGLPVEGPWTLAALATGVLFLVLGIGFGTWKTRIPHAGWLFVLLPIPAAIFLLIARPEILYFRYFLVLLPFYYVALAAMLARLLISPIRAFQVGAVIALAGYCFLQSFRVHDLVVIGRGNYNAALRAVALSPVSNKLVTSDHDSRNRALLQFFVRRDTTCSAVEYLPFAEAGGRAGWLIRHSQDSLSQKPELFLHSPEGSYRLVATFPYAGVSGWHWFLYRAEPRPPSFMAKLSQGKSSSIR